MCDVENAIGPRLYRLPTSPAAIWYSTETMNPPLPIGSDGAATGVHRAQRPAGEDHHAAVLCVQRRPRQSSRLLQTQIEVTELFPRSVH
jgi:hypothetical protein